MIDGARVEVSDYKKEPADFVLWKPSKTGELGWHSDFGFGRPGWHIECSAMSEKYLGKQFDIHAGGLDLIFPHHENEIAQSCCAFNTEFMAKYWMHNGYITVNNEKMSKSEGNFITVRDALKKQDGETIRYSILSGHYRSPIDFSFKALKEAKSALDRLYRASENFEYDNVIDEEFLSCLSNDLNSPQAISRLHELASEYNKGNKNAGQLLKSSAKILGLLNYDTSKWFTKDVRDDENEINNLIAERDKARSDKNFKLADEIRDKLKEMGVSIEDSNSGTKWRVD
jgi:cysteinyl-tRNA synthetase